jgi:hypothetical protein
MSLRKIGLAQAGKEVKKIALRHGRKRGAILGNEAR